MSKINIDNYEAWLLDFAEGNLSEEQQIELELFVMQHPELNINLSELSLLTTEAALINYSDKQQLKKSDSDLVSDIQFVAYIENQLSVPEKQAIDKSCANNTTLAHDLKLYQNTIVIADATVVFPDKNKLKRQNKVIWFDFSVTQYSIAASVLLLLGLYTFWPTQGYIGNAQQLAINHSSIQQDVERVNRLQADLLAENKKPENTSPGKKTQSSKTINIVSAHTLMIAENQVKNQDEQNNVKKERINEENKSLLAVSENNNNVTENISKTVVEVITERDEDIVAQQPKKKKSFWALAERALQNLNAMGVKSVNANQENSEKDNSSTYALTLGKVSVTHKSN